MRPSLDKAIVGAFVFNVVVLAALAIGQDQWDYGELFAKCLFVIMLLLVAIDIIFLICVYRCREGEANCLDRCYRLYFYLINILIPLVILGCIFLF